MAHCLMHWIFTTGMNDTNSQVFRRFLYAYPDFTTGSQTTETKRQFGGIISPALREVHQGLIA